MKTDEIYDAGLGATIIFIERFPAIKYRLMGFDQRLNITSSLTIFSIWKIQSNWYEHIR